MQDDKRLGLIAHGPAICLVCGIGLRSLPQRLVRCGDLPWYIAGHLGWQLESLTQVLMALSP
jgi:hypothetical protein